MTGFEGEEGGAAGIKSKEELINDSPIKLIADTFTSKFLPASSP